MWNVSEEFDENGAPMLVFDENNDDREVPRWIEYKADGTWDFYAFKDGEVEALFDLNPWFRPLVSWLVRQLVLREERRAASSIN